MSRRKATRPMPQLGPGEAMYLQPSMYADRTEPGVEAMLRQVSHDALMDQLGPRRRSGIWWTTYYAAQARRTHQEMLESLNRPPDPEAVEILAGPRSIMVVAWAVGLAGDGVPS